MQRGPKALPGHLRPQEQSGDVPSRMSLVLSPALTPGVVSAFAQHLQLAWPCAQAGSDSIFSFLIKTLGFCLFPIPGLVVGSVGHR